MCAGWTDGAGVQHRLGRVGDGGAWELVEGAQDLKMAGRRRAGGRPAAGEAEQGYLTSRRGAVRSQGWAARL